MTLLAPFFPPVPPMQTNMGRTLLSWVDKLDDAGVLAWGQSMDWSEPVLSVRRFSHQSFGGYPEAELSSLSLAEVLVLSGNMRLIDLLLDRTRLPERMRWSGVNIKGNEYQDVDASMALANAAIKSGNPDVLQRVLDLVLDDRIQATQWTDGNRYSPAVCLASMTDMNAETSIKMWEQLEDGLCNSIKMQWGAGFSKKIRPDMRRTFLSHACRLGHATLVHAMLDKFDLRCSFSQWQDLKFEGRIDWCTNYAAKSQEWEKEDNARWPHGRTHEHPSGLLLDGCIKQMAEIRDSFKDTPQLAQHLAASHQSLLRFLDGMSGCIDGQSLLSLDRSSLSSHLPALVGHDADLALKWFNENQVPLSIQEAIAWANRSDAMERLAARAAQGLVKIDPKNASAHMSSFVGDATEIPDHQMVAWIAQQWKLAQFIDEWPLAEKDKSMIRAAMISQRTPRVSASRAPRRV